MNKKIFIIVALLLSIACSMSCSDKKPKYKNRVFEFFLNYNPTWEVKEHVGSAIVVFFSPRVDESDYFQEILTISVQDMTKPISLSEYTRSMVEMITAVGQQTNTTTSSILESVPIKISGKPAHKLVYTLTQYGNPPEFVEAGVSPRIDAEGGTIQMMLVWTMKESRVYLFTYVAQKDSYDIFVKDIDAMIQSFRFL